MSGKLFIALQQQRKLCEDSSEEDTKTNNEQNYDFSLGTYSDVSK
jgi:hypothetical protein